ncbi:hypothetical protein AKJ40_00840 [candidate division MSBL1 archaeon SCGC-AAA259M10]|uniref:Uncharacterized protein n=1 Tax=candidate division MSBL1 archaeon SCGC-AAA259M10 TaxID=1698270 RepID=A0A133V2S3_9EURY|nr:hypothetical protein AKJ40_00840 [candidate division MSBL1 archaeon SCGC-AAA259M10]
MWKRERGPEKMSEKRLKKISGRERDILLRACKGYVSTLFTMMLKGDDEVESEEKDAQNLDRVRVDFHHSTQRILRMGNYHVDREKVGFLAVITGILSLWTGVCTAFGPLSPKIGLPIIGVLVGLSTASGITWFIHGNHI